MKKIFTLITIAFLAITAATITSCGSDSDNNTDNESSSTTDDSAALVGKWATTIDHTYTAGISEQLDIVYTFFSDGTFSFYCYGSNSGRTTYSGTYSYKKGVLYISYTYMENPVESSFYASVSGSKLKITEGYDKQDLELTKQ